MWQVRTAGIAGSKGLGLFATKTIGQGTRILSEKPLLSLRSEQKPSEILSAARALDKAGRKALSALSGFEGSGLARWGRWAEVLLWSANRTPTSKLRSAWRLRNIEAAKKVLDIWRSNSFNVSATDFKYALFPTIARCNHICIPNAQANWHPSLQAFNLHAVRDIEAEEEICISYLEERGEARDARRRHLQEGYGFECQCPACDWTGDDPEPHAEAKITESMAKGRSWEQQRLKMQKRMTSISQQTSHSAPSFSADGEREMEHNDPNSAPTKSHQSPDAEVELTRAFAAMLLAQGVRGREMASMLRRLEDDVADPASSMRNRQRAMDIERDCLGEDHPEISKHR